MERKILDFIFKQSKLFRVGTTYSTFQKTSIFSNIVVLRRLIITHQLCRVDAMLKPRFPNTIIVRWGTINTLKRSPCHLASYIP
jgi:hypothetical protein